MPHALNLYALIFAVLFAVMSGPAHAATPEKSQSLTPALYVSQLGKGMDVDWVKTKQGMKFYSAHMPRDFKARGFSHVRLRITEKTSAKLFAQLDRVVGDCLKAGLIPVIAYQAKPFKKNPNTKNRQEAVAWWKDVAAHYRNAPPHVAFDLLIEATDALNQQPDALNMYFEEATTAIRASNPQRLVIISPRIRSNPNYLNELKIPSQGNGYVLAEWHFDAAGPKNWTTGTAQEKQAIMDLISAAKAWQEKTGLPTWVGAWMPGDYNKGNHFNIAEQVGFATFVSCALDKAHIPFAINSDTKFYDRKRGTWLAHMHPVLDGVLNPSCVH